MKGCIVPRLFCSSFGFREFSMGGMAAQASVFPVIMNLDVSKGRKSSSNRRLPIIRIATQIRVSVSPISMNLDLSEDMNSSPIRRRKGDPHPNLWSFDLIHSLRSSYGERCYRERAEMLISDIKGMFNAMDDGEISPSAYDTAWVAKVAAVDDIFRPQFPEALEWILQNQLEDGSWGTPFQFLLSDRLLSTLSCVITLTKWNTGDHQVHQGLAFLRNNLRLMNDESQDSLVAEMELIFPSLLNEAKLLGLSLPYDLHHVHQLFRKREERLAMISVDSYRNVPSSLWYRLEGLQDIIDWERVMDVQSKDGSFLSSPAATACVYIHTGDRKCIAFLNNVLAKFRSYVPCVYPVDLLERLLAVDTVERLGIGRVFEREIKKALDYVYRYWDYERGIGYGRESLVPDLETTALGFRLLRLHHYNVSSAVFEQFKDHSGLFSSAGEISHIKEVESMLSLHEASQIVFPGEDTLDEARTFTASYLGEALRKGEAFRLWNDRQNLAQEIKYALENPWYSSIPRFEAKRYCQVYLPDHGRLGKCIYKLPLVYNEKYLELAKLDFNIVQSVHQEEMKEVTRWFRDSGLAQLSLRQRPIELYFTVCLWTFEPEFRACRFQYTKFSCLLLLLDDIYDIYGSLDELVVFTDAVKRWDLSMSRTLTGHMKACFKILHDTVHEVACEAEKEQRRELLALFRAAWEDYCESVLQEAEWLAAEHVPTFDAYLKTGTISVGQVLLIFGGIFLLGHSLSENFMRQGDHLSKFIELVSIASRLLNDMKSFEAEKARGELATGIGCYMKDNPASTEADALNHMYGIIDSAMKEMTWYSLKPDNVPFLCKKYIFDAARSFMVIYKNRDGYSDPNKDISDYIRECLIEPVLM